MLSLLSSKARKAGLCGSQRGGGKGSIPFARSRIHATYSLIKMKIYSVGRPFRGPYLALSQPQPSVTQVV